MNNNFFALISELQKNIDWLNHVLKGGDRETVTIDGVVKPTISKDITDHWSAISGMVQGRATYQLKSELPLSPVDGKLLAEVWNDSDVENNGLYGWDGSKWEPSKYDLKNFVYLLQAVKQDRASPTENLIINAVRDRFSTKLYIPLKHYVGNGSRPQLNVYSENAIQYFGETNAIDGRIDGAASTRDGSVSVIALPDDLVAAGIVPDDTTPPRIVLRQARDKNAPGQKGLVQSFILLQYSDEPFKPSYDVNNDVLFHDQSSSAMWLGSGDSLWNHTASAISDSNVLAYIHRGVPLPATYKGKPFRGIKLMWASDNDPDANGLRGIIAYGHAVTTMLDKDNSPCLNTPEDYISSASGQDIDALKDDIDALHENNDSQLRPIIINAVKNRFGKDGGEVSENLKFRGGELKHYFDEDMNDAYGVRSVLRAKSFDVNPGLNTPIISARITPQDLADIGVVPNDTSPPAISVRASKVFSLDLNQTEAQQMYVLIRYGADVLGEHYLFGNDVLFMNGGGSALWLGSGDDSWSHTAQRVTEDLRRVYLHNGIKIPATYKGMPFSGVLISFLGNSMEKGDAQISLSDLAVIAGDSVDLNNLYLNKPDDLPQLQNIKREQFSDQLQKQLVWRDEDGGVPNVVTIKNSSKITLIGDSYTASHYTQRDKAYICRLSELTDWRIENFARSGDDFQEANQRLVNRVPEYHDKLSFIDYGSTYGLSVLYANGSFDLAASYEFYQDNIDRLTQSIMSAGAKPILSTQYVIQNVAALNALRQAGEKFDCPIIELQSFNASVGKNAVSYAGHRAGGHPGVRNGTVFYEPLLKNISTLPRPEQGIKLYRQRPTSNISDIQELLYDDISQRVQNWQEIRVGHASLSENQASYYDSLDQVSKFEFIYHHSEYLKLQSGEDVHFPGRALVEVILPATSINCSGVALHLGVNEPVYCRNVITDAGFSAYTKQQAFIVDAFPSVINGAVYEYNSKQFTITGTATDHNGNKLLLTTNYQYGHGGAGTLTHVSGSGASTISFTRATAGFDPRYYPLVQKPKGVWKKLNNEHGRVTIGASEIQEAMQYDKLIFLVDSVNGFTINDISVEWIGTHGKHRASLPLVKEKIGHNQLLANPTFDSLVGWELFGGVKQKNTFDGVYPLCVSKVVNISSTTYVRQKFNLSAQSRVLDTFDVVVWARRYPTDFDPADDYASAPITSDSYDYRTVGVRILRTENDNKVQILTCKGLVGLGFTELRFRLDVPIDFVMAKDMWIEVFSPDGDLSEMELARVEVQQ